MYSEPMPASKRKAFSEPMPQPYSDMMGIELVLHASLLHSMREGDSTDETKEAACSVTSQLEAQERAEKLAANNFNQTNCPRFCLLHRELSVGIIFKLCI